MHTYIHTSATTAIAAATTTTTGGWGASVESFEMLGAVRAAPQSSLPGLLGPERLGPIHPNTAGGMAGEGRGCVWGGHYPHHCYLNTYVLDKDGKLSPYRVAGGSVFALREVAT